MGLMKEHVQETEPTFEVTPDKANEKIVVVFEYQARNARGLPYRTRMRVEYLLNLDGDMGGDGVTPTDYSSWLPTFVSEDVASVQQFMDSNFGSIDFSDRIRPEFIGYCGDGGPDYAAAVLEIIEQIKAGMQ